MKAVFCVLILILALSVYSAPSNVTAFHRSGQTFITWDEDGSSSYDVYRHTAAITSSNIGSATKVADALGQNTTDFPRGGVVGIDRVVIQGVTGDGTGTQLSATTGLFVYTTHESGDFHYAVTTGGSQAVSTANTAGPITEAESEIEHVVALQRDNGAFKAMIQFMDYANWNPAWDGYIYLYGLYVPTDPIPPSGAPLGIQLHGYGAHGGSSRWSGTKTDRFWISTDDRRCTWHYGHVDGKGNVVNYTEMRHLDAIDWTIRNHNVDTNRIVVTGGSMGGSGTNDMVLRYPNVFAAGTANLGMTDYSNTSTGWHDDVAKKWGTLAENLPIINIGKYAEHLKKYDGTPVFEWMNHHAMLPKMAGEEAAFLASMHASLDNSVSYPAQGQDFYPALNTAKRGYVGWIYPTGHSGNWNACSPNINHYNWLLNNVGHNGGMDYRFRKDYSFPAFSNSQKTGNYQGPSRGGEKYYHWHLMWGCPWVMEYGNPSGSNVPAYAKQITDEENEYRVWIQIFLEMSPGYLPDPPITSDVVDITPRRLQKFKVIPGHQYLAQNLSASSTVLQSDTISPDANNLLTFEGFDVTPTGSWLYFRNLSTSILERPVQVLDDAYMLSPNHPNPFRPSTNIVYRIVRGKFEKGPGRVHIKVLSSRGETVKTLVNGVRDAGEHRITWNGRNNNGKLCPSGVYFLHMQTGGKKVVQKMLLRR
jgi:hypothetical protein